MEKKKKNEWKTILIYSSFQLIKEDYQELLMLLSHTTIIVIIRAPIKQLNKVTQKQTL